MVPNLALAACTLFVLFMLRLERRQASGVSRALWLPTIWLLHAASKPLAVWFPSSGGEAAEYGSPMDRNFLIVLLVLGVVILIRRHFDLSTALRENAWLIVLILFMALSIAWSPIPFTSFKRWTRELLAVVMGFVVLSERSPRQALESILRRTVYILIPFSILLIKYFPALGVEYGRWSGARMWIGVAQQKNGLGRLCIIAILFLLWSLLRRRKGAYPAAWKYHVQAELLILLVALWLLRGPGGGAYSATAVIALGSGLLVYAGLVLMGKRGLAIRPAPIMAMMAVIMVFGIVTLFTSGRAVGAVAPTIGRNATLTDRTAVWNALLPVVMSRPVLGNGFGGFWTPQVREAFSISEAHSGYLDILIGLGFAGMVLTAAYYLSVSRKALRELARELDWGALWLSFVVLALVHNISESSMHSVTSHLPAVILFFAVGGSGTARPGASEAGPEGPF